MSFAELIEVANAYGRDETYSRAGGGNASIKEDGILYIKPSGVPLATLTEEDLVPLRMDVLLDALHSDAPVEGDPVRVAAQRALVRDTGRRPSVEILFHALIPQKLVLHTHPVVANALTCNENAEELIGEILGDQAIFVPYTDPGVPLARKVEEVRTAFEKRTGKPSPGITLLGNHGIIIAGDTAEEIHSLSRTLTTAVQTAIDAAPAAQVPSVDAEEYRRVVTHVSPALRGLLRDGNRLAVITSDCGDLARQGMLLAEGPLIPDQIVYAGSIPLVLETKGHDDLVTYAEQAVAQYREKYGKNPIVVVVPGVAVLAAGKDLTAARTALLTYTDAVRVARDANRLGAVRVMTQRERGFIENWEAESYRKKIAAGHSGGRLDGKVVVVTGAAQGFGLGIAQELAKEGAHLVLGDLNLAQAQVEAEKLGGRALEVNVSDEHSTKDFVAQICEIYGGADVFISNAGVLRAGSVMTQPVADFDLVTAVNYKGYFLCVQAIAPTMAIQHRTAPDVWFDIIEINSKSGLEGSKRNFAYAGSKFGGIGLTQSFALELVEDGIKVNAICPGNYLDGPLWMDPERGLFVQYLEAGKVPGAKTIDDVREFYEAKVPMRRGCVPADLATAIYYIVEQTYETGQAVPVTGGQNMLS